MKLGIFSDLHLEHDQGPEFYNFVPEEGVFYINAGDTDATAMFKNNFIHEHEEIMFSILGNHDYWEGDFIEYPESMHIREVGGLKIAGATLWTQIADYGRFGKYQQNLNDGHYINGMNFDNYNRIHMLHREFLFDSKADIIVSHHSPSMAGMTERFKNDEMNYCYHNNFFDRIYEMEHPPKLWIHGHTHEPMNYMIKSTRVLCNPRGYPHDECYWNFKPLIVEI